ncbi:MAG: hypothetical protein J7L71_04670, partial [Spirochaetaceae bacterium]|nr:hypothetical protein [Spirochaetaceae bacterium]
LNKSITETEKITLTQNENLLTFYFSILDFTAPERNNYYTYIEGYDSDWNFRGNKNSLTLNSLPYGSYKLHVKGTNHTGVEINDNLELEIKILPYFWQTVYFKAIILITAILLLFLIIKRRTLALERHNKELRMFSAHIIEIREEERKKIARDVHDELGQILTALKMEIFRFSDKEKSKTMLSLVNLTLDSVKNLSTRLRPKILDTLSLSEALQWQTVEFQRRTEIKCTVDIEDIEDLEDIANNSDKQTITVIFRIYQEILTNIIRHSYADHVHIYFHRDGNKIYLRVKDNGRGIPVGKINSSESFGIIGIRERCSRLKGKLKITSLEKGTLIEVTIPLENKLSAKAINK